MKFRENRTYVELKYDQLVDVVGGQPCENRTYVELK